MRIRLIAGCLAMMFVGASAQAQPASDQSAIGPLAPPGLPATLESTGPAPAVAPGAGTAAPPAAGRGETHLYLGMVTTHLNADHLHVDNNWLVGITHGHFYGATFLNSFGDRAFAVGAQKILFSGRNPSKRASLGVRAGAITGYDERFLGFAKDTPVLPMFSVFSLFEVKRAGVELSWTLVIASASFCIRF